MSAIVFDLANLITTIFGAALGGVIGAIVSYRFYIKGKTLEILTSWMADNVGEISIRQSLPQFFGHDSISCIPVGDAPTNPDVPRINNFYAVRTQTSSGTKLQILFRVSDQEWNFPMAAGVSIKDDNGTQYMATNSYFGYMVSEITIPAGQPAGIFRIHFDLRDLPDGGKNPNVCHQSIEINLS